MIRLQKLVCNKEFIILNGTILSFLLMIITFSPLRPSDEILLFTSDAVTYYNSGGECFDFTSQGDSWTRPFLYSFFLKQFHTIGGAWLIVLFQSIFWVSSANLIYYGIKNISNRLSARIIAVSVFAVNLSLISYIFHGLTEVISVFFISCVTYLITLTIKRGTNIKTLLGIAFLLSLLTVTKPVFQYPFAFFLSIILIYHFRSFLKNPKLILGVLITVAPVLLQLTIMKSKYDTVKISAIGGLTMDKYLVAQGIREIETITDVKTSQEIALNMNSADKKAYLWNNRATYFKLYFKNLKDNITGYGTSIVLPAHLPVKKYVNFMAEYNELNYILFILFLPVFIVFSFADTLRKKLIQNWQQLFTGLLLYYIIFSSGISFWQADRLVIFSIPFWIILYALLSIRVINHKFVIAFFQQRKKK